MDREEAKEHRALAGPAYTPVPAPVDPTINEPAAPKVRGQDAVSPWAIPMSGWKQVAIRTWEEAGTDNLGLISAGVAFYCFLAIVPLLGVVVLSYGIFADVATVVENVQTLAAVMPREAATLIGEQLLNIVTASDGKKGLGLLIALAVSLYGGMNAAGAIVMALNVAYEEVERRSFLALYLRTLIMTVFALVALVAAILFLAAVAHLQWIVTGLPWPLVLLGKLIGYALLIAIGAAAAATLYRYGPDRAHARWSWLTPGSLLAAGLWAIASLGFGVYVANFGNYDATYGSLGAVIILLTWLYLSAYVLLLGAELNAELEHQTAQDSTVGPEAPLGERGAAMADTVAPDRPAKTKQVGPLTPQEAPPSEPSFAKDLATSRLTARAGGIAGVPRISMAPSLLVTVGLMLLRRRGRAALGTALLASGGGLAWLSREKAGSEITR